MSGGTQVHGRSAAAIAEAVSALAEKRVLSLVEEALAAGENSADIVRAVQAGMRAVGERYEQQDIYLAGLIMAGEIYRGVMKLAGPGLESKLVGNTSGRVLLGTVAGDIHDIGKNMAALAFRSFGFTVEDLGVDVPPHRFLEAAKDFDPDVVGMSGLLSLAFTSMRDTVALFRENAHQFDPMPLLMIGGGTVDENVAQYVGTDMWTVDAMDGVRQCQQVLETRR
jgi:methylmalonyl-CoA mutase cobalamin-binding domain/chain